MGTYSEYALKWVGTRMGSRKHHQIVDYYNQIKPLPRGYRLQYSDPWCAGFTSVVLNKCGAVNAPYECSVLYMKKKAQQNKQIVKNPRINDLVVYNWNGDSVPDHVGIIMAISDNLLSVVEGNYNRQVKVRYINKNATTIDCFIRVKQQDLNTDLVSVARDVIAGKYGNGKDRKTKLESEGYNYKKVQAIVNQLLTD